MKPKFVGAVRHRDHFANGGCYICRENEGVIDLGVVVEGEGRLGICVKHAGQVARVLKWEKPEIVAAQAKELERTKATLTVQQAAIREKEELIDSLTKERESVQALLVEEREQNATLQAEIEQFTHKPSDA